MEGRRVLAFVLAGGRSSRLRPLSALDPKPALPLAGRRLIDFTLSNLVNSGVGEIYVLAQHRPRSIVEHVEEVWAPLLRRSGHVATVILPRDAPDGVFLGTADAVYKNLDIVRRHEPDLVAVFGAGQAYRMDVGQMAAFHARNAAGAITYSIRARSSSCSRRRIFKARPTSSGTSCRVHRARIARSPMISRKTACLDCSPGRSPGTGAT